MSTRVWLFTFFFSVILHCAICAVIFFFSKIDEYPEETVYHVSLAEFASAPVSQASASAQQLSADLNPAPELSPEPEVTPLPPKSAPLLTPKRQPLKAKQPEQASAPDRSKEQPVQPGDKTGSKAQTGEPGGAEQGGTQRIGGLNVYAENAVEQRPAISRRALPVYPEHARRRNIQGMVIVRIIVDISGNPQQCSIQSSSPEGIFDEVALTAARKTRFIPGKVAGRPVNTTVLLPYKFSVN